MNMDEALTDYREAQASGLHHIDCDGWMTSHRVEIAVTRHDNGSKSFTPVCEECGKLGIGGFGQENDAIRFQAGHGQEVKCDGRCHSWD